MKFLICGDVDLNLWSSTGEMFTGMRTRRNVIWKKFRELRTNHARGEGTSPIWSANYLRLEVGMSYLSEKFDEISLLMATATSLKETGRLWRLKIEIPQYPTSAELIKNKYVVQGNWWYVWLIVGSHLLFSCSHGQIRTEWITLADSIIASRMFCKHKLSSAVLTGFYLKWLLAIHSDV